MGKSEGGLLFIYFSDGVGGSGGEGSSLLGGYGSGGSSVFGYVGLRRSYSSGGGYRRSLVGSGSGLSSFRLSIIRGICSSIIGGCGFDS